MGKRIGANRRLKRKKKKQEEKAGIGNHVYGLIKVVCLLAGVAALGFVGAKKSVAYINNINFFKVENITIRGIEQIDTSEVLSLAAIEPGVSMINLKVSAIRKRIKMNPWVAKAHVRRRIPNTVVITIIEREPVAFINMGSVYLVDRTGFLWPLKLNTYWNLPVVSGLTDTIVNGDKHRLNEEGLLRMNNFFKDISGTEESITLGVSQMDFSREGVICVKLGTSPTTVELGSISIKRNLKNLCEILRTIESNSEKMPRHINLCYNNIAFVR